MDRTTRDARLGALAGERFDVAVVGGGIAGASVFQRLGALGYRPLLVDAGDFACGTSQASAMMIWGGLLYLRNADIANVCRLSRARDDLLARGVVRPLTVRYVSEGTTRPQLLALHLYWLLGRCRRRRPRREDRFAEQALLADGPARPCLTYEEAMVEPSDARFVLRRVVGAEAGWAFNYCRLEGGGYDPGARLWRLDLRDQLTGRPVAARARWVVNAAGVGADRVNAAFAVAPPYRHLFSKGVFLGLPPRPGHDGPLIFSVPGDYMAWAPWGPIALWGPTETVTDDIDAAREPTAADVTSLLHELNRHLKEPFAAVDVVSVRCGVRALAVRRDRPATDSRRLSRRPLVWVDPGRPWASVFGGNFTAAGQLADAVVATLRRRGLVPSGLPPKDDRDDPNPPQIVCPGLPDPLPEPAWCCAHEQCWHLEDYVRRRTNVAPWLANGGFGKDDENRPFLESVARALHDSDAAAARALESYEARVVAERRRLFPDLPRSPYETRDSRRPPRRHARPDGSEPLAAVDGRRRGSGP